jgi:shikimate dehydrogenase
MHNAAFRALDLDWTYELFDVLPGELPAALKRLRLPDVAGANVTIPHKQAVMQHMDGLDPEAVKARAVNTIVHDGDRLVGSNTDIAAIRSAIASVGVEPKGANVVIFGAGGSARAASVALEGAHVTFVSRHPDEADVAGRTIAWDDPTLPAQVRSADLLVNATPLGRREEMPIRPGALPRAGAVVDLVYVTEGRRSCARPGRSVCARLTVGRSCWRRAPGRSRPGPAAPRP